MAINLNSVKDKYNYAGTSFRRLMSRIIDRNSKDLSQLVFEQSTRNIDKSIKKLKGAKRVVLPSFDDVATDERVRVRKSVERGRLLTDTLKGELANDLRSMFTELTPKTMEQRIIRRT